MANIELSRIWDGEEHLFTPGEDFRAEGATLIVVGYEELEEEEELSPYESPSRRPILHDTRPAVWDRDADRFPLAPTEQAWGSLSLTLTALAQILEIKKHQYQLVPPFGPGEHCWSFRTDEPITERL